MEYSVYVLLIVLFLMGMVVGYVFKDWKRLHNKKRTIKKVNEEWNKMYPNTLFSTGDLKGTNVSYIFIKSKDYTSCNENDDEEDIETMLKKAIEEEDFEEAARIRDILKSKKNKNK
jgi:excinuclease UvrABC helicase subunit UvrB